MEGAMTDKRLRGAALDIALDNLLRRWEVEPPEVRPIHPRSVAKALPASPTSLYKDAHPSLEYPTEPTNLRPRNARIEAAAKRQAEAFSTIKGDATGYNKRIHELEEACAEWQRKCEELQMRIAGMEYHASLNGWDAEKLWKELPPNDRTKRGPAWAAHGSRQRGPYQRR